MSGSDLPHKMTLSGMMVQARTLGAVQTQSGLMDGEPACIVAAHGKNAERIMRFIKRNFDPSETDQMELP